MKRVLDDTTFFSRITNSKIKMRRKPTNVFRSMFFRIKRHNTPAQVGYRFHDKVIFFTTFSAVRKNT